MLSVKDVDEKRKMTRIKLQLLKSERETELLVFVNGCWPALTRDCSHSCFACRDFGLISRGLFPQVISARHHLTPGASTGGFPGLLPTANLQEWTFVYGSLCLSQGWPCLTFSHPCSIVLILEAWVREIKNKTLPFSYELLLLIIRLLARATRVWIYEIGRKTAEFVAEEWRTPNCLDSLLLSQNHVPHSEMIFQNPSLRQQAAW